MSTIDIMCLEKETINIIFSTIKITSWTRLDIWFYLITCLNQNNKAPRHPTPQQFSKLYVVCQNNTNTIKLAKRRGRGRGWRRIKTRKGIKRYFSFFLQAGELGFWLKNSIFLKAGVVEFVLEQRFLGYLGGLGRLASRLEMLMEILTSRDTWYPTDKLPW